MHLLLEFKKDFKKLKNNKSIQVKLTEALSILEETGTLPIIKYKTHALKGKYKNSEEAHLDYDLLIIWIKIDLDINIYRIGTHSELFNM